MVRGQAAVKPWSSLPPSLRLSHLPQELRTQLESALHEVEQLHEARERQREMVESIVKQRDMYRTLLAQATPLPPDKSPRAKVQYLYACVVLAGDSKAL